MLSLLTCHWGTRGISLREKQCSINNKILTSTVRGSWAGNVTTTGYTISSWSSIYQFIKCVACMYALFCVFLSTIFKTLTMYHTSSATLYSYYITKKTPRGQTIYNSHAISPSSCQTVRKRLCTFSTTFFLALSHRTTKLLLLAALLSALVRWAFFSSPSRTHLYVFACFVLLFFGVHQRFRPVLSSQRK